MHRIDFQNRTALNFQRLSSDIYQIQNIFQPESYSWQGDWEGRALLAFVCLYKITGKEIPCMHQMVEKLEEKTQGKGYFGSTPKDTVNEQQLSGHSWYLRGLIAYDEEFPSEKVKGYLKSTFQDLYYSAKDAYTRYPLNQGEGEAGDVSGDNKGKIGEWELSTDTGCAFMALDGVSDYYRYTKDERAKELLEIMVGVFMKIDRLGIKAQTHATLSGGRGILRFYQCTKEEKYLNYAKSIMELYEKEGMTLDYENYNWFRRPLWTEPCCIVDSLILSAELYKETREGHYLILARRIFHNGFAFCQRSNGGAGTNTCVNEENGVLSVHDCYEATFCCTMRFSEGLLFAFQNESLLFKNINLHYKPLMDEKRRYFSGDILLCEDISEKGATKEYIPEKVFEIDGLKLIPIIQLYKLSEEKAKNVKLKIIF